MALLEINDLEVKMGDQQILRKMNLKVPGKKIVSVLGSNGVGKTTLMRAVGGIYKSSSGTISLTGLPRLLSNKGFARLRKGVRFFQI